MPWQRLVADVGSEIDLETNLPAYREVIVTVPRQNGKTTLLLSWELERALLWGMPQKVTFSAQTGLDARKKLLDDQLPMLERTALWAAVNKVTRAQGSEGVVFKNGSRIDVLASTDSAGHGRTIDLAVLDEVFADADDRREQAILPAMATRAAAQLLVVSTMGTEGSVLLNRKVAAGRAAVERGQNHGIAYFEWSAPAELDPDDPTTWRMCMPALGHTITEQVVAHARQTMSDGEFRRSFLNQQTSTEERVIPLAAWQAVCSDHVVPDGRLTFGVDVNPERSASAIVAADERGRAELVEHRAGVGWVADRLSELCRRWDATVNVDPYGPAGSLISELEARRVPFEAFGARQMTQACGQLYDAVLERRIQVRTHPAFDDALAAARRRTSGDAWLWSRSQTTRADITPLVALTLALTRTSGTLTEEPQILFL